MPLLRLQACAFAYSGFSSVCDPYRVVAQRRNRTPARWGVRYELMPAAFPGWSGGVHQPDAPTTACSYRATAGGRRSGERSGPVVSTRTTRCARPGRARFRALSLVLQAGRVQCAWAYRPGRVLIPVNFEGPGLARSMPWSPPILDRQAHLSSRLIFASIALC